MRLHGPCAIPLALIGALLGQPLAYAGNDDAAATVAALDRQYQAAVKRHDDVTMASILAEDFVLIVGNGSAHGKQELLDDARSGQVRYEQQDEIEQHVRVWGDTAVVSALLWVKGERAGSAFDHRVWFSDVYVRSDTGWHYVLGQVGPQQ